MRKLTALVLTGVMLTVTQAYAGNGDLIVDGNLGVGTTTSNPADLKLNVIGNSKLGGNATIGRSGGHYDEFTYNVNFTNTADTYSYLRDDYASSIRMGYLGDIEFRTAPWGSANTALTLTNRMIIKQNGDVGIGTTDPKNFKLNVFGNAKLGGNTTIGRSGGHYDEITYNAGFTGTNNTYYYVTNDTAASIRLGYGESIEFRTAPTGPAGTPLFFTDRMKLDADGLNVYGAVKSNGSVLTSDIKFKKNLLPINDSLSKVLNLEGVSYEWKRNEYKDKGFPEGRHYGVIAQEIEKVLPEVVNTAADGTKAVAYTEIIPVLVEAIKEQQALITQQQALIENQQQEISAIKMMIQKIK